MKLQQGQIWKKDNDYIRIVHLERLEVKYKVIQDITSREGEHHHVSKKEFCRLIKGATLLTEEDVSSERFNLSNERNLAAKKSNQTSA